MSKLYYVQEFCLPVGFFFTSILCKKLRAEIALFNLLSNYDDVDLQFFGADRMFE